MGTTTGGNEEVLYRKINGMDNPTDLFTKHLTRIRIDYLPGFLHMDDAEGKAQEGLAI